MKLLKAILIVLCLSAGNLFSQNVATIPNVFTPNGDGDNDIFTVSAPGYEELTCSIFNRHGEVVYRFFGLNGSWDGFTHAGVKVSAGVYFVYLEVSSSDGSSDTQQATLQVHY